MPWLLMAGGHYLLGIVLFPQSHISVKSDIENPQDKGKVFQLI